MRKEGEFHFSRLPKSKAPEPSISFYSHVQFPKEGDGDHLSHLFYMMTPSGNELPQLYFFIRPLQHLLVQSSSLEEKPFAVIDITSWAPELTPSTGEHDRKLQATWVLS